MLVKDSITISIKVQNIIAAIYHSCDHFNSFKKCTQCAHVMSQFTYMIFYENLFSRRASSAMFSGTENMDLSRWTRNLEFSSILKYISHFTQYDLYQYFEPKLLHLFK